MTSGDTRRTIAYLRARGFYAPNISLRPSRFRASISNLASEKIITYSVPLFVRATTPLVSAIPFARLISFVDVMRFNVPEMYSHGRWSKKSNTYSRHPVTAGMQQLGRDVCIYSGEDSDTDDGQGRDVISWQGPKSREESMVSSVSTRVVPRCRCNNPRRSYRHTYTPT